MSTPKYDSLAGQSTTPPQALRSDGNAPLLRFDVLQPHSVSSTQTVTRLFNTPQETLIMFETVVEPFLFRLEADQYTGWLAVPRDHDFLRLRFAKITR